jgi:hypothetical protein
MPKGPQLSAKAWLSIGVLVVLTAGLSSCAKKKFYRVTDMSDGTVFYTRTFDPAEARDIGMARFIDANSAALIRLEDYKAERISKKKFRKVLPKD